MGNGESKGQMSELVSDIGKGNVESIVSKRLEANDALVTIPSTASVSDALEILAKGKCTAAPLMNAGEVVAMVETLDIVRYVVGLYSEAQSNAQLNGGTLADMPAWVREQLMDAEGARFFVDPIDLVVAKAANLVTVELTTPLTELSKIFTSGARRALVVKNGKPLTVVSQIDMVAFLVTEFLADHLKAFETMTLLELQLGVDKTVATVNADEPAIKAFWSMSTFFISSVPVLDPSNKMIMTQISVTDLKGLRPDNFNALLLPCSEYIDVVSPQKQAPVCATPNTTFGELLDKFAGNNLHRVWVTDSNREIMGVVSLEDLIKLVRDLCE